jgi:uncharacterized surface protein with fasciclin (FAS1) repeats
MIRKLVLIPAAALALCWTGAAIAGHHGDHAGNADIVETAQNADGFETLVAAIEAAGLADTLKGEGPYTVFAPTDAAFEKLPEGTLDSLLRDENRDKLIAILSYHVVPGKVTSEQVAGLSDATTVEGGELSISRSGNSVMINDATVTTADIVASNGVIHVIDTVLLPN